MLADDYGWDVHVPPSSPPDGVQLIGARRCLYADGRIPHVMYRVNGQDVSLFVLEGVTRPDADVTVVRPPLAHLVARRRRPTCWCRRSAGDMTTAARYVMRRSALA